ncbi:MAG: UPF0280 family protein [Candidatus Omnitrophica bacterium]|nr:UPF0280 family protein [Candidatus Omnitrophota bacterium]MDD5352967.1 UPF0280 family protein [Candidatus Omnitrophota bacterium]MDD5550566.1 UPF0280 family protein [Candidatus Omnitrophota bacterium]
MYEQRVYRDWVKEDDLMGFQVMVKETDLFVKAERDLSIETVDLVTEYRAQIEEYVRTDPEFQTTLKPYKVNGKAPFIVREMAKAAALVGVGPFAAVAGAIAECVGKDLLKYTKDIIIENGGDIFIKSSLKRRVAIYSGTSSFNKKIALEIEAKDTPMGICTSAGTIGHSLSFGKADAAVVLSSSAFLADAGATAIGNIVKNKDDIPQGIKFAQGVKGITGVVIIKDDKMGAWGNVNIVRI